jgi:hypothetical protein
MTDVPDDALFESEETTPDGDDGLRLFADSEEQHAESQAVAAFPDGSGAVLLTGPGAGTAVVDADAASPGVARIPTRDDALDGASPVMLVHRGRYCTTYVPHVLGNVHAATAGRVRLGAVVDLPGRSPDANRQALDAARAAALRIADPRGFLCTPDVVAAPAIGHTHLRRAPYLGGRATDVQQVLDAQRSVGANLLLTSGRALEPGDAAEALSAATDEGDAALANLQPGERLALNLTLPAAWLISPALRTELLNHLLDQEQFDV